MYFWFFICVLGAIAVVPAHFLSVEHTKLQGRYGEKKGKKIGEILGLISGWVFFLFWIGIWISPQPRFNIPFFQNLLVFIPFLNFSISIFNLLISVRFPDSFHFCNPQAVSNIPQDKTGGTPTRHC